jgi:predicted GH43/DUF377 family glycosyl hydrolase
MRISWRTLNIAMHYVVDDLVSFPSVLIRSFTFRAESAFLARPMANDPVLALGKENDWDEMGVSWGSVVRINDSNWRMYFSGREKSYNLRIGMATSNDGVHWTKYSNNPILNNGSPGSWNHYFVYCPIVWKEDNSWKMLFTGVDSPQKRHHQVGLAESQDGITWKEFKGNPVYCNNYPSTRNIHGQFETEAWGVLHERDRYYLFYNSVTTKPRQVYVAESADLKSWKPVSANPILLSEGHPWSLGFMKYCAFPFKHHDDWYLLAATSDLNYHRSRIGLWRLRDITFSAMGAEFVGYVLGTSHDWCKREVEAPFPIYDAGNKKLLCYYGGRSVQNIWTEGLAVIDVEDLARARGKMFFAVFQPRSMLSNPYHRPTQNSKTAPHANIHICFLHGITLKCIYRLDLPRQSQSHNC